MELFSERNGSQVIEIDFTRTQSDEVDAHLRRSWQQSAIAESIELNIDFRTRELENHRNCGSLRSIGLRGTRDEPRML